MITLTNTPSATERSVGLNLLAAWWRASTLSQNTMYRTAASFDGLVKYWDNTYPNSIEWLGEQLENYSYDKLKEIVLDHAKNEGAAYIRPANITKKLLLIEGNKGFFTFASEAVAETASDVGTGIVWVARLGLIVSIAFFLFLGWGYIKAVKK